MFLRERMIEAFSRECENLLFLACLGEDKDGLQEEELGSGEDLRIGLMPFSHPASWTSPGNRIVEWKAKNLRNWAVFFVVI